MDRDTLTAVLDSVAHPLVYVDTDHVIRYLNKAARESYAARGYADLVGKSLFDCHNETSAVMIRGIVDELRTSGIDEKYLKISADGSFKLYVRAVRNSRGELIGYYERFAQLNP